MNGWDCCEHCERMVKHDPIWVAMKLRHTTPCRICHLIGPNTGQGATK